MLKTFVEKKHTCFHQRFDSWEQAIQAGCEPLKKDNTITQAYVDLVIKCVKMAASHGVILVFETKETPFMDTCRKSMTYVSAINSPYCQIYPDLGNLTNASRISKISVEDDLISARGHIVAAHLKEIVEGKYREIPYGTGDTRFEEALKELKKQGVSLFTGEFWYVGNPNWKDDLVFASTYLRTLIEKFGI